MNIYGAKKGGGKQRQPVIAPDSAQSKTFISIMYGLGEGEIAGLTNGYKSVYLEDTPLQNDDGEFNFPNVKVDFRTGTNDQEYIDGFPDVASETAVNVELKHGTPYIKAFNNLDLDALRVRLKWGALRQQNRENGDVSGVKIDYAIDVKTDNGGWVEALNTSINAKTSDAYERSHRIDLPKAQTGWQLRVRRITPNSTSEFISDKMYIAAISEVIDLKLRYPNTALLGLRYDAESFSNVAKMSARCKGLIIKVPTNYDPVARTYTGMWDGQFKMAYSNNPAWVYYDLCTAERYGLGGRLTQSMIDKWSLYRLAQYCDEMVDDGMGGQEPRFTVNVYIQSADGAFELLSRLAGVFRAISYWDGNSIVLDADIPQDSIYSFSRANVIDGVFEYTGTRSRDRRTVAKVAWDNPANHFKTEYEYVRDEAAIAKFGVRVADIAAWGCTSKGQAQRAGLWALKSEQLETRMVTFKVGLDGYIPAPAKVIEISDELFAGRATGGRVLAINKTKTVITLDRTITAKAGDTLVINADDGTSQRRQIRSVSGDKITVTKAFGDISVENVWVLDSQDLATMKFRVLSVTADENHQFTITAVQYNPNKYDAIDTGVYIDERPISVINPTVQAPTKSVNLSSYHTVNQSVSITTLVIGWEQVAGAVKYQVEWRKDNGNWQSLPPTGTNSIEIAGVYAGAYEARVTAISAFGQASLATHSNLTEIQGKVGKPSRPAFIRATGVLFGMNLAWGFGAKSDDTNFTEIQVSPDGRSNITTLGTFAYPTNKHEITGLQGNLTQFYRGRIVDKLGNTSDWTAWQRGTTSADASKVLDILSGQISASHLDQTLRAPIAKINTLDSSIATISGKMPGIETSIAKIPNIEQQIRLDTSKLAGAIKNIDDLTKDKNAKTQELIDLKQTVGGQTLTIRELGVTTGDLSQKYLQLKTTSDGYDSEIKKIQQTTKDQAIEQKKLTAKFDSFEVGGRNLLLDSKSRQRQASNQGYNYETYTLTEMLVIGQSYTFKAKIEFVAGTSDKVTVYDYVGGTRKHVNVKDGYITTTFVATSDEPTTFLVYAGQSAQTQGKAINITNAKLERGTVATDWTPAPEDVNVDLSPYATTASLDEFKRTQATKDTATAKRIANLDTAYRNADNQLSGRITTAQNTATNVQNAVATARTELNARFDGLAVGGRNLLKNSNPGVANANYVHRFKLTNAPSVGDEVMVTLWGDMGADRTGIGVYNTQGYTELFKLAKIADGVYQGKGRWRLPMNGSTPRTPNDTHLNVYFYPKSATSQNRIDRIKLEKGNVATDWTPAPEDLQADIDSKANATALNDLSTRVTQVDGRITAEANKVSQLQTTLNGQTTSIRNVEQSVNGVRAIKAVTVDNNGFISGYGLMSELQNGRVTSRFGINADQIYFGGTTSAKKPFVLNTRPTTIDGVNYPAGAWLNSASIADASIKLAHIDKASINSLSALSANIGHFKSAQTGARLEIKDSLLSVYDENNVLRVRLGLW